MNKSRSDAERVDVLPSRPLRTSLAEIGAMSLLATTLAGFILGLPADDMMTSIAAAAPVAGGEVLNHIGWGFGVYIPVLLGFYAIVIGRQLVASPGEAARTRQQLGLVAEALMGTMVPALLLVCWFCILNPIKAGALFVVLPAAAVTFFLSAKLGGFAVVEDSVRLKQAIESMDWARDRLTDLHVRSGQPTWVVMLITSVVAGVLGYGVASLLTPDRSISPVGILIFALLAVGFFIICMTAVRIRYTARDIPSHILAWLMPGLMLLLVLIVATGLASDGSLGVGVGLILVPILCALSAIFPRLGSHKSVAAWTIKGVGVRSAAREVVRGYRRSSRLVRDLQPKVDEPLIERLLRRVSDLWKRSTP